MQVFVINLPRSLDRREHMTAELGKTGLDYEFITAVDGRELDLQDPTLVAPALQARSEFFAGAAGCALSHLRAYEKVVDRGLEHALILEDDVTLPTDLGAVTASVAPHLTGAEVALLNYGRLDLCSMGRAGAVALPASRWLALPIDIRGLRHTSGYVITREACERMLKGALPLRADADEWEFFYREGMLDRIRCVQPVAVEKSPEFGSTIGFYGLGDGVKARLVQPLLRRQRPIVHQAILYRRQRILRRWQRSELVDSPFIDKPSRLD